ncbi:MAG: cyanophycin synthetase, partial [Clostridium baratii]|nr:cyanophycin synthetase [Clostridium baratii]
LIGVIGIPGDRSNDMAKEIGMISSANLDKIIIKEDKDRRGREKGEICNLIKEGIDEEKDCKIILDESEALIEALKISDKGDIIVMFFEQLDPLVKVIKDISDNGMNENIVNM